MRIEQAFKVPARHRGQHAISRCSCLERARYVIEQCNFAKHTARIDLGDLSGLWLALAAYQYATRDDDVEGLTLLPLVKDDFTLQNRRS